MEKPSTFDRAFWILWISMVVKFLLIELKTIFDPLGEKYHPDSILYYGFIFATFLCSSWFYFQIKKAKDWARILNIIVKIVYSTFFIFTHLHDFLNGVFPSTVVLQIILTGYLLIDILRIYASLIVFSKKSTEYINYQYHLKQDLKREKKENNSSQN